MIWYLHDVYFSFEAIFNFGYYNVFSRKIDLLRARRGASDGRVKLIDYNSATFFDEPTEPGGTPE